MTLTATGSSTLIFAGEMLKTACGCLKDERYSTYRAIRPFSTRSCQPMGTAENRYEHFDDKDNVVQWGSLVIIAKPRPSSEPSPSIS
jgi:hypothetical protein